MTHSLHRQGTYENLGDDFVVLFSPSPDREPPDHRMRLDRFREIGSRHQPLNAPRIDSATSRRHLLYGSKDKISGLLQNLVAADLQTPIIVSGLRDQVDCCCREAGLRAPGVNQSLGFWGNTRHLPDARVLDITTMCGHGRVAPNLVWDLAKQVQQRSLDPGEAAGKMGKLCMCTIFNEARATRLLRDLVAGLEARTIAGPPPRQRRNMVTRKDFGITVDMDKCIQCLECLPYCPLAAIVESPDGKTVFIDADLCTECGLCRQVAVCPVDAIVGLDLTWPRSIRGKFLHRYAAYRSGPQSLAPTTQPVSYSEEAKRGAAPGFFRHDFPDLRFEAGDVPLGHDEAVVIVELGRPHLGAPFRDVQRVIRALVPWGLQLGLQYPNADERGSMAELAADVASGILRPDILGERGGCVWLKLMAREENVPSVLQSLRRAAAEIDTVFALDVISRIADDGSTVADRVAGQTGVRPALNCKMNVGLGHA